MPEGATPLYIAACNGHPDVVRALLQAPGIRVNPAAGGRFNPLGAVAQRGHMTITRLLLMNGADPNHKGDRGLTPLHAVCLRGHTPVAEMLLHYGADPDAEAQDPGGQVQTPYDLAGLGGHHEALSVLEVYRRCRAAAQRPGGLPVPAAPAGNGETPALSGAQVAGETVAAAARVPPRLPAPSPPGEAVPGTAPPTSLAQAKHAVREELLRKFLAHYIDRQQADQLLAVVNTAADLENLCVPVRRAGARRARPVGGADRSGYAEVCPG